MSALEGALVPASANLTFPNGAEDWTVSIPPTFALTGAQLGQLTTYCATNKIALSAQFSYLGMT